jgi:TaqI-like C-terminal specificity domain
MNCGFPRKPELYTLPKIVGPEIASRGEFTLYREELFVNNKVKAIILRDGIAETLEYVLCLLNSSLLVYLYRSIAPPKGNNYFEVKTAVIGKIPIRTLDFSNPDDVARHDRMVKLVDSMLSLHESLAEAKIEGERTVVQHQIDATDRQIDRLVYDLYGLTDEEIEIVEQQSRQGG